MVLIKVNGIHLNVNIKGEGPPIISIHGLGRDHTQYARIDEELSKHFKTITPDLRGHGASDKPDHYDLQDHVDDIIAILDFYQIKTIWLHGISGGSYVAQGVAIAAPERITKLILTVPKSNGLTSSMQRLFDQHAAEIAGKDSKEKAMALLKYFTYDPQAIKQHDDLLENKLTQEQFNIASKALSDFDFRKDLAGITAKTLVISGKYDGLNPPENGKEVASLIPQSAYIEMQYSGHLPMHEEPETFLKIVKDFLLNK